MSAAVGVADRLQLGASVPHIVGSGDVGAVVGSLGTTIVSGKMRADGRSIWGKACGGPNRGNSGRDCDPIAHTGESRSQVGLPVSLEIGGHVARAFASAGYFSNGVWFAGGGLGAPATSHVALSAAVSRAWSTDGAGTILHDRRDVSGGAAFTITPRIARFGSLGTTVATRDQDGAGTTVSGGVLVLFTPTAVS